MADGIEGQRVMRDILRARGVQETRPFDDRRKAREKRYGDLWDESRSGSAVYADCFRQVWPGNEDDRDDYYDYIKKWTENFQNREGRKPLVLDLMSYGAFARSLDVPGLSLALTDRRSRKEKREDRQGERGLLIGSVMSSKSWKRIEDYLRERQARGFDLITCRPEGGLRNIPENEGLYGAVLSRAYSRLAEEGIMVSQFHPSMEERVRVSMGRLSQTRGIKAEVWVGKVPLRIDNVAVFGLKKERGAPDRLILS